MKKFFVFRLVKNTTEPYNKNRDFITENKHGLHFLNLEI